ncbi:MAG: FAD-dependent oxidoreductase [Clostridia bacterium]|nr:FAD-dependent oxidoreductase [Clostridia bacterium]
MIKADVTIIGGGPAGLAAAIEADKNGAKVLLIEREARLGGILKQCIHDGFGLVRFGERLTGPEYAERFMQEFNERNIEAKTLTFVTQIDRTGEGYTLTLVSRDGMHKVLTKTIILATGCRERTAKQVFIHGTRPAGVFTAGTAQNFVNLCGVMPTQKCVILGSGDIGLIMARRLTLEGAKVLGVYELQPTPSGLTRNIHQCLHDYNIPLYLSHTVTRVFGHDRLTAVEVAQVDENKKPIDSTRQIIECDSLILSVGLIPENELAETLDIKIDPNTKGPVCDQNLQTMLKGVYSCGNALHVNDLVDFVSESGETAGRNAAAWTPKKRLFASLFPGDGVAYVVPQKMDLTDENQKAIVYFRSKKVFTKSSLQVIVNGVSVYEKKYNHLRPPEMERIEIDFAGFDLKAGDTVTLKIKEGEA